MNRVHLSLAYAAGLASVLVVLWADDHLPRLVAEYGAFALLSSLFLASPMVEPQ